MPCHVMYVWTFEDMGITGPRFSCSKSVQQRGYRAASRCAVIRHLYDDSLLLPISRVPMCVQTSLFHFTFVLVTSCSLSGTHCYLHLLYPHSFHHSKLCLLLYSLYHRGVLKIAEVRSRFEEEAGGVEKFVAAIETLGFSPTSKPDRKNKMFVLFEFRKVGGGSGSAPSLGSKRKDAGDGGRPQSSGKKHTARASGNGDDDGDDDDDVDETIVAASKSLLKPCIYKRR